MTFPASGAYRPLLAGLESYLDDGGIVPGADSPYFDRERWKRDARTDGRAHVISGYDGREDEESIYRQN